MGSFLWPPPDVLETAISGIVVISKIVYEALLAWVFGSGCQDNCGGAREDRCSHLREDEVQINGRHARVSGPGKRPSKTRDPAPKIPY